MLAPEPDQRIRSYRRNFKKHKQVENVPRKHNAVHPRNHKQKQTQVLRLGRIPLHVPGAKKHRRKTDHADSQNNKLTQPVKHKINPQRNRPPPHPVHLRLTDRRNRQNKQRPRRNVSQQRRTRPPFLTENRKQKRRYQRNSNKNGQWYAHPFNLLICVISKVPYFSYVRMQIEIIRASDPRLITIAVSTNA